MTRLIILAILLCSCSPRQPMRSTKAPATYSLARSSITWGHETYATDSTTPGRVESPHSRYVIYQFNGSNRVGINARLQATSTGSNHIFAMAPDYGVHRWVIIPHGLDGKTITLDFSPGPQHISPKGNFYIALIAGERAAFEIDRTVCTFTEVYTPLPDEILAIPLKEDLQVGEGVQVAVLTGPLSFPFAYLNSAAVVGGGGMAYLGDSFNVGALGGGKWEADGIWSGMCSAFLPFEDSWMVPFYAGDETYYVVNVTPIAPLGKESAEGWLFNLAVDFDQPGEWHIRLLGHNGEALTTYYSGEDGANRRVWALTSNPAGFLEVYE